MDPKARRGLSRALTNLGQGRFMEIDQDELRAIFGAGRKDNCLPERKIRRFADRYQCIFHDGNWTTYGSRFEKLAKESAFPTGKRSKETLDNF
jgi:hypothetical protein